MAIIGINGYSTSGKDTVGLIIQYILSKQRAPINNISIEDIIKEPLEHQWWLDEQSTWSIKKFAYKLKLIASIILGVPVEMFEDETFKNSELPECWDLWAYKPITSGTDVEPKFDKEVFRRKMTVREFLQKLGTEGLRNGVHENIWVNALMADYKRPSHWEDRFYRNGVISGREEVWGDLPNWIITDTRFPNEAQAIKDKGGIIIRTDRPNVGPKNNHASETSLDNWQFDYKIWNGSDVFSLISSVESILKHLKIIS